MVQAVTTPRRRSRLAVDLTVLGLVGVLLIGALTAGGLSLYRQFYGPAAFVERYLSLLAEGRAADALRIPGVAIDSATLESAGIDITASEALLRATVLAPLNGVEVTSEKVDGDTTTVGVSYTAAGHSGTTEFTVQQDGWVGVTPNWRFSHSPLSAVELTLRGADTFHVNGFEIDRRQIAAEGPDADPLDPLPLLVFTPGVYSLTVDTPISTSAGVTVLADAPLSSTPVDVQTMPTGAFVEVVQERVEQFLGECTQQKVLLPTACPFGFEVFDRVVDLPTWSIAEQPTVTVEPDGADWRIPTTDAVAHIEVDVQSLYDGSIQRVSEDVPFQVNGTIAILPDGSASIRVGSPTDAPDVEG